MFNGGSSSIKWYPRLKVFKNSTGTVEFDPQDMRGRSYNWIFLAKVKDVLVFNDYTWSSTTSHHQSAVRSVLREKGLSYVCGDFGSVNVSAIGRSTVEKLYKQVFELEVKIDSSNRKDSRAQEWRVSSRESILENIEKLVKIDKRRFYISKKIQSEIRAEAFENEMNRVSDLECEKCFKFLSLKRMSEDVNEVNLENL